MEKIILLIALVSPLLQCKAAVTSVQKMSDTDKAYFMADYLVKHEGVSHYVYESLMAFKELVAFVSNHTQTNSSEPMDSKTSQQIEQFAIVHFPDLIRHPLFEGVSLVLTQEFEKAFAKTFPSPKEGMKEFQNNSSVTLNKVLSNVDVPVTLTKLLFTFEKPIEAMRHEKDSTLYIERLRNGILLLLSPMVQQVMGAKSARDVLPRMKGIDTVDETCYNDVVDMFDAAKDKKMWALKMIDAFGKPSEGLIKGNINLLGSHDSCMESKGVIQPGERIGGTNVSGPRYPLHVSGRFCRVKVQIPDSIKSSLGVNTRGIPLEVTWGVCVPSTCNRNSVFDLFRLAAIKNKTSAVESVYCPEDKEITEDSSAVAAICILSVFGALLLAGSLFQWKQTQGALMKDKVKGQNAKEMKTFDNSAYQKDEHYTSLKFENGSVDLPKGYMQHKEAEVVTMEKGMNGNHNYNGINGVSKHPPSENEKPKERSPKQKEGTIAKILKAFAIQINAKKIMSAKTGSNSINCIHGIRFFSITWIMLGHTYNYGIVSVPSVWTTENFVDAIDIIKRFSYQAVIGAGFGVDTFFMISGMLLTYLQLKQMKKMAENVNGGKACRYVFHYYLHRFWRLTPMYAFVLMIYGTLFQYMGSGPLWPEAVQSSVNCRSYWWTNILYINNIVYRDEECMAWSWYLSNDMQFYVISIFLLLFLTISIPLGVIVTLALMAAGIASAAWKESIYNGNFFTMKSDGGNFWNNVYIAPWCRVAAYCVGVFLGVIFYKRPKKVFSRKLAWAGWALSTGLGLFLVYITHTENKEGGTPWTVAMRTAYESLGRPVWAACVAWVIFACHNGMGGYVNSILSWKGLIPLSRLSYAAYLVHPMLMMLHMYSKRTLFFISDYDIIYLFLGHTVMTFMVSFVLSCAFEAPFMALEKLIF